MDTALTWVTDNWPVVSGFLVSLVMVLKVTAFGRRNQRLLDAANVMILRTKNMNMPAEPAGVSSVEQGIKASVQDQSDAVIHALDLSIAKAEQKVTGSTSKKPGLLLVKSVFPLAGKLLTLFAGCLLIVAVASCTTVRNADGSSTTKMDTVAMEKGTDLLLRITDRIEKYTGAADTADTQGDIAASQDADTTAQRLKALRQDVQNGTVSPAAAAAILKTFGG